LESLGWVVGVLLALFAAAAIPAAVVIAITFPIILFAWGVAEVPALILLVPPVLIAWWIGRSVLRRRRREKAESH
jgi:hypothetical protein